MSKAGRDEAAKDLQDAAVAYGETLMAMNEGAGTLADVEAALLSLRNNALYYHESCLED